MVELVGFEPQAVTQKTAPQYTPASSNHAPLENSGYANTSAYDEALKVKMIETKTNVRTSRMIMTFRIGFK